MTTKNNLESILKVDYKIDNTKMVLDEEYNSDLLNRIKSGLKSYGSLYELAIDIISPVYTIAYKRNLNKFLKDTFEKNEDSIIINLGSGTTQIHEKVINVDVSKYPNVDFVCDISNLPFKDNSIDAIVSVAVLEHVRNPSKVIDEAYRVLKPGGSIFSYIPFIQGFHASPDDYQRYTSEGIVVLHEKFDILNKKNIGWPTSAFLWVLQEWLALFLSFGIKKLHIFWTLFFMLLTFPIKFLDVILQFHPMSKNISTGFVFVGEKPENENDITNDVFS